jgi:hypothetical protein
VPDNQGRRFDSFTHGALLSALLDHDCHNRTADQHTAEVTFTPTGRRPQGRSLCDVSRESPSHAYLTIVVLRTVPRPSMLTSTVCPSPM